MTQRVPKLIAWVGLDSVVPAVVMRDTLHSGAPLLASKEAEAKEPLSKVQHEQ